MAHDISSPDEPANNAHGTNGHGEERALPSGAMVREHWNQWQRFTSMTKVGIVVVLAVVAFAMIFIA